jgi:cysteine-rich repeat protein
MLRPLPFLALPLLLPGCIDWASLYQSHCGNGQVEAGEECDDGNRTDTDACLSTCKWATCGDGHVRAGVDDCDDGNVTDGDGCSSKCLLCKSGSANFLFPENGYCYSRHDDQVTWDAAEATCDSQSSYLVTFVNSHEADAVETTLLSAASSSTWIGLADLAMNNTYGWITYEPVQWNKWTGGRPSIPGGCTIERSTPSVPRPSVDWATVPCDRALGFVCEQAPPSIRPEDHHAYRALYARLSWFDARDACARSGGHLVTIQDQAENAFVASLMGGDFWIGAIDPSGAGAADASCPTGVDIVSHYQWVTGDPVTTTIFAPGEPDHADCAKCLIMGGDEGWHDRPCDLERFYAPYVCEIE